MLVVSNAPTDDRGHPVRWVDLGHFQAKAAHEMQDHAVLTGDERTNRMATLHRVRKGDAKQTTYLWSNPAYQPH